MKKIILGIILSFAFVAQAQAAVLNLESSANSVGQGQLFLITVNLSGEGEKINAVSGELVFNPIESQVIQIYDGASIITNWLDQPVVGSCLPQCSINFSGVIAGGFSGVLSPYYEGSRPGRLFSVLMQAKTIGSLSLDVVNPRAYLHDGSGTTASIRVQSLSVNSISDKPLAPAPTLEDNVGPEPFAVSVNREKSLFNNKYFIVFNTQDKDSGIARYEVKEGEGEFILAESPYLLKNQRLGQEITVRAVDHGGNETFASTHPVPADTNYNNNLIWVIIFVLMLLAFAVRTYETKFKK